ncbi:phage tail tape measure protein [Henriciella mobilis]|uniref:phage tail tape measure protein n=1 Tax=Henriciella mobilis TaxID=2305467 RepID=UPI000E66AB3A|nr:phage tail tape measure protein [Henriciella mobilis]RIJ15945.1 phage tail tape measure protein [Henriciella mobilis]RIJ21155.1 phage tail tape measure protein [Henriciella mobilis]RIJ23144.1 phage tail tape measure protein [Henriciella mobilis]
MAVRADSVIVELEARVAEYERKIAGADRKFDKHMDSMRRQAGLTERRNVQAFNNISTSANNMGRTLAGAASALALAAGAAAGIRVLAGFSQAMSTVQAVTQATEAQIASLTDRARELGATTRFSATQAAEGMLFLARAGFDTEQVLGSIEGTLQLAQAGNLDLGRAADIASNVLQGFRLEVSETARVVDVLAKAANSSNTDVNQLGEAMKYVSPVAAGLNVGIEDTAAAVSALSDAGIQAEMAGTGLRRVMIGLEKQSSQGEKVLAKYGLKMEDIALSSTGSLADSLNRLSDAGIATADAMTLFGLRGGPAFEVLQSSIPKVRELSKAYDEAGGTAERVSKIMDDNLNGALLQTRSRLEELVLALGEAGAEDGLIIALENLQKLLIVAAENADILGVAIIALSVRALLPLAAKALPAAAGGIAALNAQLTVANAIAGTSVTRLGAVSAVAGRLGLLMGGPLTLAIAAAATAFVVLGRDARAGERAIEEARASIESMNAALENTSEFDAFNEVRNGADGSIPALNRMRDAVREISEALNEVTSATIVQQFSLVTGEIAKAEAKLEDLRDKQADAEKIQRIQRGSVYKETGFEDSILEVEQKLAVLRGQASGILEGAFGEGGVNIGEALADGGVEGLRKALDRRSTELRNVGLIEAELEQIDKLKDSLEQARAAGTDAAVERFQQQIEIAEETIRLLEAGLDEVTARDLARETVQGERTSGGPTSTADIDAAKDALKELEDAFKTTYQIERDEAKAAYDEQIKAIETLGLKGEEATLKRGHALEAYLAEVNRINDAEEKADKDKLDRELDIIDQIAAARDRLAGRGFALIEREYDRRAKAIEDEIEHEGRRNEALAALAEERALAEEEYRKKVMGEGEYSSDPADQIEAQRDTEIKDLKELLEKKQILEEEYELRRQEIIAESEEKIAEIRAQSAIQQLEAGQQLFDGLAGLAKTFAGEQSGIYKALFAVEKAFAIASSIVQIQSGVAKALSLPFPSNLAAAATVAAQGAQVVSTIQGVAANFGGGRERGGPVRPDEFYEVNEKGKPELLERGGKYYLMSGGYGQVQPAVTAPNMEAQLARISQPVNPTYVSGGGQRVSVTGSPVNFYGPVNQDTLPDMMRELEARDRRMLENVRREISREKKRSTPRHQRERFLNG